MQTELHPRWGIYTKTISTLLLVIGFSSNLYAQAFDPSWRAIPKSFKGDNLIELVQVLDTKKGEYESTEAFTNRMAQISTSDRTYFFFCDDVPFDMKYDADEQVFNFKRNSWEAFVQLAKIQKDGKSYYGSNVFGVTRKVRELWNTSYVLQDQDWDRKSGVAFSLPCSASEAPSIKKNLGVALMIKVVKHKHYGKEYNRMENPYFYTSSYYGEATVSSPLEYISKTNIIVCDILRVVLYRKTDRSILLVAKLNKANIQIQ